MHKVFQNHFLIGAAVNPRTLVSQQKLIKKHFNSITAENEMKMEQLQPKEGHFNFEVADEIVLFSQENGMKVRGHTLVWHNQTPDWMFENEDGSVVNRETLLARMKTHITTVMERYKEQIYCWDVVNEVIEDNGTNLLRESKWTKIIGEDFIGKAFEYAHQADPKALLFYNDYNESHPEKREKIYELIKELVEKGIPIHGIGLQAHWNLSGPSYDHIKTAIKKYGSLGLKIHITEMDISVFNWEDRREELTEPTEEMLAIQAERYQGVFKILREYSDIISSVNFWGVADDYTWLDDFPIVGRKNWPFIFDENYQPKESFWNIVDF